MHLQIGRDTQERKKTWHFSQKMYLQTFVMTESKTICRNYLCTKSFILVNYFLKNKIFSFFPTVKMKANYAETCRIGNLEADFNKFHLLNFSEIFTMLFWNIDDLNSAK